MPGPICKLFVTRKFIIVDLSCSTVTLQSNESGIYGIDPMMINDTIKTCKIHKLPKSHPILYWYGIQCGDGGNSSFYGPGWPKLLKNFPVVFCFGNMTIARRFLSPGKTFTHNWKGTEWWLALKFSVFPWLQNVIVWFPAHCSFPVFHRIFFLFPVFCHLFGAFPAFRHKYNAPSIYHEEIAYLIHGGLTQRQSWSLQVYLLQLFHLFLYNLT